MLNIIKSALLQFIDNIDAGNSIISEQEELDIINLLLKINLQELSKVESADYLGVCRATFDNYIAKGLLPPGHKRLGFKELSWSKSDLYEFKQMKCKDTKNSI